MMRPVSNKPTLRNRLMRHVLLPLALTWLLGSLLMLTIASYFTQQAYDRALLDDAYLVASHVRQKANATEVDIELSLSAQEMSTVLFRPNREHVFCGIAFGWFIGGGACGFASHVVGRSKCTAI